MNHKFHQLLECHNLGNQMLHQVNQYLQDNSLKVNRSTSIDESILRLENGPAVWMALNDYRKAKPVKAKAADVPDALIVNKAKAIASASRQTFRSLYTFDTAAQALTDTKSPPP